MKIGLVPMSAKPYHAGHDLLVRLASKENDVVKLFVSTSDREEISGDAMKRIWHTLIAPTLPDNVDVIYGGSPVANVYKEIGEAEQESSTDTYRIYSDPTDVQANYPDKNLVKYTPHMFAAGNVIKRPVSRTSTVNVSGGMMRQFLRNGEKNKFIDLLPPNVNGEKVWQVLKASPARHVAKHVVRNESYIRKLVRESLRQNVVFGNNDKITFRRTDTRDIFR
jgi:ATP sulfurylase